MQKVYMCIDLKSFFASVECSERHIDPFETCLAVVDSERGKGSICLAITPKMKELGIKNRCRLYEIPEDLDYIAAKPRMKLYMEYAADIYSIYLKYISSSDIHVYSIDEVFIDVTSYLYMYNMKAYELAQMIINDIYETTHIRATVGIGTNMYLAKIALDMLAKHDPSFIASLNEKMYQKYLWDYTPLTDFWQVGRGIANRLEKYDIYTMKDITMCHEELLYKEFGINAEYLIDHAWGKEPTTIEDIKRYTPKNNSISHGQVLCEDYNYDDALIVVKEMVELKVLDLVDHHLSSDCIFLNIGYSKNIHKTTGGSMSLSVRTNSYSILLEQFVYLYKKTTNPCYPIRRITIGFSNLKDEIYEYYDLFTDIEAIEKERQLQHALIDIKQKYGKNAVLKGMNTFENSTTIKRNKMIGGHNAI